MSLSSAGSDNIFKFMTLRSPEKHKEIKSIKINPAILSSSAYLKSVSAAVVKTKQERPKLVTHYSSLRDSIVKKMLDRESVQDSLVAEQGKTAICKIVLKDREQLAALNPFS